MACGVPVITTGGFERSTIYKDVVFFIKPKDSESITSSIKKLLSDSSLRNNFITKGLKFSSQFDWDRISSQIENELISIKVGNQK